MPLAMSLIRASEEPPNGARSRLPSSLSYGTMAAADQFPTFARMIVLPQGLSSLDDRGIVRLDPALGQFRILLRRGPRYDAQRCP